MVEGQVTMTICAIIFFSNLIIGLLCTRRFSKVFHIYPNRYSKTGVKRPLSKGNKKKIQDPLLLNAGQKYCRMLQR